MRGERCSHLVTIPSTHTREPSSQADRERGVTCLEPKLEGGRETEMCVCVGRRGRDTPALKSNVELLKLLAIRIIHCQNILTQSVLEGQNLQLGLIQ